MVDPSMVAPEVNLAPGPEYADEGRMFQGIPGIERAVNGRLWALWYGGGTTEGDENYVALATSGDDGANWSGPVLVIAPSGAVRAFDPCLWHDPKGRLWLFWAQSYHLWDGRAGVWAIVAEDSGNERPVWSEPQRLCDGIALNKPTVLSNGDWLLPASVWERGAVDGVPEEYARGPDEETGANAVVSTDQGETWSLRGRAIVPNRIFDEHMIVERRDGSLWMLVRSTDGMGESFSTDGGRTWSAGRKGAIEHVNSRFFIRRLQSGNLLLIKHSPPDGTTRSHLTAYLSEDDGVSWKGGLMLDERARVSYPDGVQAPDGTIYAIYDFDRQGERKILMATMREEDVARGRCVSPQARLQVLVNQATGERPE